VDSLEEKDLLPYLKKKLIGKISGTNKEVWYLSQSSKIISKVLL
jgi:hypothetical protein